MGMMKSFVVGTPIMLDDISEEGYSDAPGSAHNSVSNIADQAE